MDQNTRRMLLDWLAEFGGDVERLAKWMRDHLRIGGLKVCRELIQQALS